MNSVFTLQSLLRAVLFIPLFILACVTAQAQVDVYISNTTGFDMQIYVEGTDDCSTMSCSATVTVDAGDIHTETLACDYAVAGQVREAGTADPFVNLLTTFCACEVGDNIEIETFMIGATLITVRQRCYGDGISIDIF